MQKERKETKTQEGEWTRRTKKGEKSKDPDRGRGLSRVMRTKTQKEGTNGTNTV